MILRWTSENHLSLLTQTEKVWKKDFDFFFSVTTKNSQKVWLFSFALYIWRKKNENTKLTSYVSCLCVCACTCTHMCVHSKWNWETPHMEGWHQAFQVLSCQSYSLSLSFLMAARVLTFSVNIVKMTKWQLRNSRKMEYAHQNNLYMRPTCPRYFFLPVFFVQIPVISVWNSPTHDHMLKIKPKKKKWVW